MWNLDTAIILLYVLIGAVVWGVWYANGLIRKGFNKVIEGLQSIDERLAKSGSGVASKGKTCSVCGASVEEGAKFCMKCGGKVA